MLSKTIQIIEPTLKDQSGHCYSFVLSLVNAKPLLRYELWVARTAILGANEFRNCLVHNYFSRRLRKIQKYFLLRKLMQRKENIFFSTAETLDLVYYKYLGAKTPVYFYFHWFRDSKSKRSRLKKISSTVPMANILVPTNSVADLFKECGFQNVRVIAYPYQINTDSRKMSEAKFTHLLYAGAARADKGFLRVVEFVKFLKSKGETLPVTIQITRDHGKEHTKDILRGINDLKECGYNNLILIDKIPSADKFGELFQGSICLQLYDSDDFKDRVSGITLDSLSHGAPVITTQDTWLSRSVVPHGAGLSVSTENYSTILENIKKIAIDYSNYSSSARKRSEELRIENDAAQLATVLSEEN